MRAREQTKTRIPRERSKTAPLPSLERDTLAETRSLSDIDELAMPEGRLEVELASDREALLRSSTVMVLSTSPNNSDAALFFSYDKELAWTWLGEPRVKSSPYRCCYYRCWIIAVVERGIYPTPH